ncbi:hypothetical protein [uncultured Massilia sp.]|uniref:hypothetical protein n=1 Tax=uncultured Massilia sp. TaxID=169973 RepID=UPI002590352A|nr:hypothetical protein [uncultured Massilia sp.]
MNQTPPELRAPYKAALVAAARDYLRAAGNEGAAVEIPGTVPPAVIVVGAEENLGQLLRAPVREPLVGGRRAGDPPMPVLSFDEPASSNDGPPVVDTPDLVAIRRWLQAASKSSRSVTLSGAAARALCYAMDTGMPMEPAGKERNGG